jgi:DNA primase catalytic core
MARIPEREIERLKEEISVARLVEAAGIELKPSGKDQLGRCPFHDDAEPSLVITPAKNLWHCFGCGIGGGPIDWVMKKNRVSFRYAVELLRAQPPVAAEGAPARIAKLAPPVAMDAGEQELLDQVIGFYHHTLLQSPEALAYLEKRGIADRELIERFRLGFANRTLGLRLPVKQLKAGAEIRGRLQRLGVLRESGHEHFNGCLVVPVFDEAGRVTEVYGRKITEGVNPPLHLYLPEPGRGGNPRGVWNVQGLVGQVEVILCEALIDAMTFWCAGYKNVTASYGAEGMTAEHVAVFKRLGVQRVLIAYDRDDGGDRGAGKVAERLHAEGFACYRVLFPHGMDANDYARKVTPAAKSLGVLIRKAVWLGTGPTPSETPGQHVENFEPTTPPPSLAAQDKPAAAPAPVTEPVTPTNDDECSVAFGERRYRVRGLAKNLSYETLKVNVLVAKGESYYVDTFDLYAAKARNASGSAPPRLPAPGSTHDLERDR